MKRALPYLVFAAITLAAFWKFFAFGELIYKAAAVQKHLDPWNNSSTWLDGGAGDERISDDVLLLPLHHRLYGEGLKAGELRLWNPWLFCGYPAYANPMLHPFYPPNLALHALLSPAAAHELVLMLHLFFSGVAMFGALGALGRSPAAATAGAVVWMLFGYNAVWFSTVTLLGTSVFAPLALRWIVEGLKQGNAGRAAPAGLAMGMAIIGSHPQHALHVFLFLLAWIAAASGETRFRLRFGALFAVVAVGAGLVEILARLETISTGYRDVGALRWFYQEPGTVLAHSLELVIGRAFYPADSATWFHEFHIFAGLGAASLAVLGAARRETRFVAIFAASVLAVAFVQPLANLWELVPLLNMSPSCRWLYVFGFCLAILASAGLDALKEAGGRFPAAVAAVAVAVLGISAMGLGLRMPGAGASVRAFVGFGLAVAMAWAAWKRRAAAVPLALGALLVELLPSFLLFTRHEDASVLGEVPPAIRTVVEREGPGSLWRGTGVLSGAFHGKVRPPTFHLHAGGNMLAWHGVENVVGFDAVVPESYVLFAAAAGARVGLGGRILQVVNFDSPLWDLAGLKYLFFPLATNPPGRFRPAGDFGTVRVFENEAAFPRAWLASGVRVARDPGQALEILREQGFDARREVVLEVDEAPVLPPGPPRAEAKARRPTSDTFEVSVTSDREAILVVAESHYPGWEATVDGTPAPILKANLAFRAVRVPAGSHEVRFRFRPGSVRIGAVGSILFGLGTLAFIGARRRAAHSPSSTP